MAGASSSTVPQTGGEFFGELTMATRLTAGAVVSCAPAEIRLPPPPPLIIRFKEEAPPEGRRPHDPDPEAIEALTAVIREGWSKKEERKRRRWSIAPPVELVEYRASAAG